mmetsp:Transcript_56954/g.114181  ORF Transcript_56954/g.114181 Transcript_56954/m.114181 type:complete len:214 (+) Transcript_56954:446-1087(+)
MFLGYFKLEEEAAKRYDEHVDSITDNFTSSECVLIQLPTRNFPRTTRLSVQKTDNKKKSSKVSKAASPTPASAAKRKKPSYQLEDPADDDATMVAVVADSNGSENSDVKDKDNGDSVWVKVIKQCVKNAPEKTIKLSVLKKAVISAVSSLQSQRDAPDHSPLETSAAMEVCFAAALANAGRRIEVLEASGTEEATMVRYLKKSKKRDSKSNRS